MELLTVKQLKNITEEISIFSPEATDIIYSMCYHLIKDLEPGIEVTIGFSPTNILEYGIQTGDNSYSGAAYHFPHWAVGYVPNEKTIKNLKYESFTMASNLLESFY